MARTSLTPFGFGGSDPILSLHRDMNRLFDDVFRGAAGQSSGQGSSAQQPTLFNARMNVSETEREVRVTVELPGVTEKDIEINLNDDVLTIRGEKTFEAERRGEKENFHYVERSYGSFQRSLRLPYPVNFEDVQAHFEHGVLTITLPKSAQQERSRKIRIRSAAQPSTQQRSQDPQAVQNDHGEAGASSSNQAGGESGGGQPQGPAH